VSSQLPLPLALAPHARFETFVAGPNAAVLRHLRSTSDTGSGDSLCIWGASGTGKSHLLQAACAVEPERRAIYLPLADIDGLEPGILEGLESFDLIAIDDIERVAALLDWNWALFTLFNSVQSEGGRLLLAASHPPAALEFQLADLASRVRALAVYQLQPLGEADLLAAMQVQARSRGLEISQASVQYLLTRTRRDMAELCRWLDSLDRASLAAQRKITIPLIRELLVGES